LVSVTPASAQTTTPPVLACGRVVAFTPPTATAAGSITLGTTTFSLKAGSLPNPAPPNLVVGAIVCMDENPAGEILAQTTLVGDTVCGQLTAMTAASVTLQGNRTRIIPVRQGTSLASAQLGANECFTFAINAAGNAEIVGFGGPAPTLTTAPGQLPSTSTAAEPNLTVPLSLVLGLSVLAALLALRKRLRHRGTRPA
jgi:hypothetical protein